MKWEAHHTNSTFGFCRLIWRQAGTLAEVYGVETRRLNEQVKRNIDRFPEAFMFQLTKEEMEDWKSQFATSNKIKMGLRKAQQPTS